eukprot:gb/GEZN01009193.1/.p1 GENE.gb/GEZN01009193.1/~~gb/GEZN01009193.1/.p1  ORF type:complete len:367 (-),score=22.07 gb/GEZN01009193.1/:181-1281(-)
MERGIGKKDVRVDWRIRVSELGVQMLRQPSAAQLSAVRQSRASSMAFFARPWWWPNSLGYSHVITSVETPTAPGNLRPLGEETLYETTTSVVVRKKECDAFTRQSKCLDCWISPCRCICERVRALKGGWPRWSDARPRFHFHLYMSRQEWRCAGNTGKLLALLFPTQTSFYVHGYRPDDLKLREAVCGRDKKVCVLFPSARSVTVPEWLSQSPAIDTADKLLVPSASPASIDVVLVDASWRQARRMAKHLSRIILPDVPQVTLSSSLTRETKTSVHHRKQASDGRICTAEALSLFLAEILSISSPVEGKRQQAFRDIIVEAVKLNSHAVAPYKAAKLSRYGGLETSKWSKYSDQTTQAHVAQTVET